MCLFLLLYDFIKLLGYMKVRLYQKYKVDKDGILSNKYFSNMVQIEKLMRMWFIASVI